MNETSQASIHPSEGDLVRYLDHQVDRDERRDLLAHLSECDACAQRVASLGEHSRIVADYLAELHADVTPDEVTRARALSAARAAQRRRPLVSGGWLRAAAVAAVVIATAGVSPVRAWVLDRIHGILEDDAAAPAAVVEAPEPLAVGSQIAFEPAGDVFNLELDAEQAVGAVRLTLAPGSRVSARVVGGDESFTLLPAGVQVENRPTSTASYEIAVPGSVRVVQLFAGDRLLGIVQVDASSSAWARSVPLQR